MGNYTPPKINPVKNCQEIVAFGRKLSAENVVDLIKAIDPKSNVDVVDAIMVLRRSTLIKAINAVSNVQGMSKIPHFGKVT